MPALALPVLLALATAPPELVDRLGADDYRDREAAGKALVDLRCAAEPAARVGTRSANPEVARRAGWVLRDLKANRWAAFAANKADWYGPAWAAFTRVVGDTPAARRVFVRAASDGRLEFLDRAAADPAVAADLYAAEAARLHASWERHFPPLGCSKRADVRRQESLAAVSPGEAAAALFLGALPRPAGTLDAETVRAFLDEALSDLVRGPDGAGGRALFAAWLAAQRDPEVIDRGLTAALWAKVPDGAAAARRVLADKSAEPAHLQTALTVLGNLGGPDDFARIAAFRGDDRAVCDIRAAGDGRRLRLDVRDVAAAMALTLANRDPAGFGFAPYPMPGAFGVGPYTTLTYFESEEARPAARAKAWAWLDARPADRDAKK